MMNNNPCYWAEGDPAKAFDVLLSIHHAIYQITGFIGFKFSALR